MTPIQLARRALDLYDQQSLQVSKLEDQIRVLKAQLNTTTALLEVSESKKLQLLKQLDTNQYKGKI